MGGYSQFHSTRHTPKWASSLCKRRYSHLSVKIKLSFTSADVGYHSLKDVTASLTSAVVKNDDFVQIVFKKTIVYLTFLKGVPKPNCIIKIKPLHVINDLKMAKFINIWTFFTTAEAKPEVIVVVVFL